MVPSQQVPILMGIPVNWYPVFDQIADPCFILCPTMKGLNRLLFFSQICEGVDNDTYRASPHTALRGGVKIIALCPSHAKAEAQSQ